MGDDTVQPCHRDPVARQERGCLLPARPGDGCHVDQLRRNVSLPPSQPNLLLEQRGVALDFAWLALLQIIHHLCTRTTERCM